MIFLSYVSEDRPRVLHYFDLLDQHALEPWMDCKSILGGQNWGYEIRNAMERSDVIVVFVSENSVDKRGYAQREIKVALDKLEEKLVNDIYIIPVQLDDGNYPYLVKDLHFINSSDKASDEKLLESVRKALRQVSENVEGAQVDAKVRWATVESKSHYNGIPGYSITSQKLALSSVKYPHVAEIADHINGQLSEYSMSARGESLKPDPEMYNLMQSEWQRTSTFDAIFSSAHVVGRVLSIKYSLNWYGAGAAHPVHAPKFFNYLLEPVHYLENVKNLFDEDSALSILRSEVERELVRNLEASSSGFVDKQWIRDGTESWESFSNFSLGSGLIASR